MQARLAALQPPVLADRRLGQRAARSDSEQREALRASRPRVGDRRVEHVLRDHAFGKVVRPLEALPARRSRACRCPTAPRGPSSPASSSTCRQPPPMPSKSREPSGPSARIRSSTGSTRSAWSRSARSCEPQWPVACHHLPEMRPQLDRQQRGLVRPVLEDAPFAQQARHDAVVERADPRARSSGGARGRPRRSSRAAPRSAGGSSSRRRSSAARRKRDA